MEWRDTTYNINIPWRKNIGRLRCKQLYVLQADSLREWCY